jgi:hypothetical protein
MSAVLEGDPAIGAAAKRVNSGPVVLRKERVEQMRKAQISLDAGLELMRLICGLFDTDGRPYLTTEMVDMRAGLGLAIGHIENASELLFNYSSTSACAQEQQAFMEVLWDSADIVFCVEAGLQHKKLPDGRGMTVCPVRGALTVAISKLEGLVGDISRLLGLNHKRGKCAAEVAHG